jgi:S1-C subfamily serine protease
VVDVEENSPAAAAEIQQCDLIRQVNGRKVRNPSEVQIAVDQGTVGEPMDITLEREGEELSVEVLPIEIPRNG